MSKMLKGRVTFDEQAAPASPSKACRAQQSGSKPEDRPYTLRAKMFEKHVFLSLEGDGLPGLLSDAQRKELHQSAGGVPTFAQGFYPGSMNPEEDRRERGMVAFAGRIGMASATYSLLKGFLFGGALTATMQDDFEDVAKDGLSDFFPPTKICEAQAKSALETMAALKAGSMGYHIFGSNCWNGAAAVYAAAGVTPLKVEWFKPR